MFTPRNTIGTIRTPLFSAVPLAPFTGALDLFVAVFLACIVLAVAALLLRTRVSPRHRFILDLLEVESSTARTAGIQPLHKSYPSRRSAA